MNVGLDTSVVLRLLLCDPPAQSAAAEAFLDELRRTGHRATVSDLVISEAYFALQFHYRISKTDALTALKAMLSAGEIANCGNAGRVLALPGLATGKPGFVDRLIHAAYTEAGGSMATFEKSTTKLPRVSVLKSASRPPRP